MLCINNKAFKNLRFGHVKWNKAGSKLLQDALKFHQVIVVDVDTQFDFMHPNPVPRQGLYVRGAEKIIPKLKIAVDALRDVILPVNRFLIPYIQTKDTHTPNDPEFKNFLAVSDSHCVEYTPGWEKIPETKIISFHRDISAQPEIPDLPVSWELPHLIDLGTSFEIHKNTYSPFEYVSLMGSDSKTGEKNYQTGPNQKVIDFFKRLKNRGSEVAIVYGVATDVCVKQTVQGLKSLGFTPIVVKDAVKGIRKDSLKDPQDPVYGDVYALTANQLKKELQKASP